MMNRILLISALLIASSLACAPHSPRRPSRPVAPKECPALGAWAPADCKAEFQLNGKTYDCMAATTTTTKFTCADNTYSPVVSGDTTYLILNSVTCDSATGKWNYDSADDVYTDNTIGTAVGEAPYLLACAKLMQ